MLDVCRMYYMFEYIPCLIIVKYILNGKMDINNTWNIWNLFDHDLVLDNNNIEILSYCDIITVCADNNFLQTLVIAWNFQLLRLIMYAYVQIFRDF